MHVNTFKWLFLLKYIEIILIYAGVAKKQRDLFRCPRTFAAIDDIDQSLTDISTDEEFRYDIYMHIHQYITK